MSEIKLLAFQTILTVRYLKRMVEVKIEIRKALNTQDIIVIEDNNSQVKILNSIEQFCWK